ncbi:hypothetical protein IWQ47_003086 [Aquimarina sp. EL_43]|uniref:hypothetical protein n=1 Tax=Aquimarina TaxID=290174 RepID=UPI000470E6FE|nr:MULTISPECIES: hypothetical protein [Aquimarina]MBG6131594.1 hypothetical protein [Aquimarina sp. EL_35]MBG6152055.1 hypothetical protein [Aquimarina sp. EL_32]MBG6170001.1 hypothetical protein [Aquimarina sp. EL_43]
MKKQEAKKLELKKFKIAKFDRLDAVRGGGIISISFIKSYDPDDCANTTGCHTYGCPGTTVIRN